MRERLSQTKKELKYCRLSEYESPMVTLDIKHLGKKSFGGVYGSVGMMILDWSTTNSKLLSVSVLNSKYMLKYLFFNI